MPYYNNPDFNRLPPGLVPIFAKSNQIGFFSLPEWYDLLTRFCLPEKNDVRIYTDASLGAQIAILLRANLADGLRCLDSLTNFYSVEHDILATSDANPRLGLDKILIEINADRPRWDRLTLAELDPGDARFDALVNTLRHTGYLVECTPGAATWFETTVGMTFAEYLAQRPSQLRNTWRRKHQAVMRSNCLSRAFFSDSARIDRGITDYQTIYAASWKPAEAFPSFIPALMRLAAELGALRLGIYYIDGKPAAAQFWIVWGGRAIIYKLAHDRRLDKLSLGTLLTMEMIERVLEQDHPSEINLGRGDDAYKRLWLSQRRLRWGIIAANPRTIRGLRLGVKREAAKVYHWIRGEAVSPRRCRFRHDDRSSTAEPI